MDERSRLKVGPSGGEFTLMQAEFSPDDVYRYSLLRVWDGSKPPCVWVMLNPSTADENVVDPTVRRCVNYSRSWGFGQLLVLNLFALRATDPDELRKVADPVGPGNDDFFQWWLRHMGPSRTRWVAGWGNRGTYRGRAAEVRKMVGPGLFCLGVTQTGEPVHPLYQRNDAEPRPFTTPVPARG